MGSCARSVVLLGVMCGCGGSGVSLDHDAVTIATYQDAPPAAVQVAFTYFGNQGFRFEGAPSWLQISLVSNDGGVGVVALTADVTKVQIGTVQTTLHFSTIETSAIYSGLADLPVTFTVWEPFAVAHDGVELATTLDGAADDPHASLALTGAQARWHTGDAPPWLTLSATAGTGNATVEVGCKKAALTKPGVLDAKLAFTDEVGGRTVTAPVRCIADAHRLVAARHGVAFSQFANLASPAIDIVVDQNGATTAHWAATSSAAWLAVTAAGATGQALHVAADATGLAPGLHDATITLTADAATIARPESIHVGFYVSTAALPNPLTRVVAGEFADPVRPYVYSLSGNKVLARNVYTNATEQTYTLPTPGPILDIATISDDGHALYVVDLAGWTDQNPLAYYSRDLYRVNLDEPAATPVLLYHEAATANGYSNDRFPLRFFRQRGVPLLFNPIGRIQHAETGAVLATFVWRATIIPTFTPIRISFDRAGDLVALSMVQPSSGDAVELRRIAVHDTTTKVTREAVIPYQYPTFYEPGAMFLGPELDRIYLRTGYLAKAGTTWTYHAKFTVDSTFLASDTGVLYAAGTDPGGRPVVGEFSKDGDLIRALSSGPAPPAWTQPWLSSDGLLIFATGNDEMTGFRR